jgi:hypothetical protein
MNDIFGPLFEWNTTNQTNQSNQTNQNESGISLIFLLGLSPLLCGAIFIIIVIVYDCICLPLHLKIKNLQYKIYNYFELLDSPIVNNKLNKQYIKKLNTENQHKIKNKIDLQCSICIEDIKIKKTLVLDCSHAFCKKCIQIWIKTQSSIGHKIECPMCRQHIVREEDMIEKEHIVVNIDNDSTYDYLDSL